MSAVVVDLGGSSVRCAVAAESGDLLAVERTPLPERRTAPMMWALLERTVVDYCERTADIAPGAPIVLAFPGPIRARRIIISAPTFAGREPVIPDIAGILERETGRSVTLINDVTAAAWQLSSSVTVDRFMVLAVSRGIGAKVFDQAHPRVIDDEPYAGEIGHVVVDRRPDAPRCDCGGRGHLGAISSGWGVERYARSRAIRHPASFGASLCAKFSVDAPRLTNEAHFVPAVRAGDAWARAVLCETIEPLATVLASAVVAAGLQRILVIGGFAAAVGPLYTQLLTRALSATIDSRATGLTLRPDFVELATLADDTTMRGAASIAPHLVT